MSHRDLIAVFKPGVSLGAGNHLDSGSLIAYWSPIPGLPCSCDVHMLERGRVPGVGNRRMLRHFTAMKNQLWLASPGRVDLLEDVARALIR